MLFNAFDYKELVIAISVLVYTLHTYLDVRQLKALRLPGPPASMAKYRQHDEEEFTKTQRYNLDKWGFGLAKGIVSLATDVYLLACNILPLFWQTAANVVADYGHASAKEIQTSVVFVLLFSGFQLILDLPWSLYSTFVIEERHGFNKQTLRLFVTDFFKQLALGLALGPPIIAGFVWILLNSGQYLVAYVGAFFLAIQLLALTLYPTVIAPLFNKFTPLEPGELRQEIEDLALSLNFPLQALYVVDGSSRSAHSNAYFFGIGKNRRIVLYDTLLDQCSNAEITAILGHELGHWRLGHVLRNFGLAQAVMLFQFAAFAFVQHNSQLQEDFGFVNVQPALIQFILFSYLLSPLDEVIGFGSHVLSRRYEFQADAFAVELNKGEELKSGLLKLEKSNRSATNVDPLFSAFHYSHPVIAERLAAIDNMLDKKK